MSRALPASVVALLMAAGLLASCSSGEAQSGGRTSGEARSGGRTGVRPGDPIAAQSFYVSPNSPAAQQASEWRAAGRASDATAIEQVAREPTATWFTGSEHSFSERVGPAIEALTRQASSVGKSTLLVAYDIPHRDCGGFSTGGAASAAAYRSWIGQFASAIGVRAATVILEPDAIAQSLTNCLSGSAVAERYRLLSDAVSALKADPHVRVYIDAGNPGWITPPARLIGPLRRSGIARADGFSLNVANFYTTAMTAEYGEKLSRALGGTHFVIDTGRNGNGPDGVSHTGLNWCNPPGRALGTAPTTDTAGPPIDAYLWIKPPGDSDGSCRPGEPRAGAWWPQYALELARNTH